LLAPVRFPDDRRRQLATLAALLWTFGYEIGPALHVSLHARLPEHRHGARGAERDPAADLHGHPHGHSHAHGHAHSHSHAQPHPRSDARERSERRGRFVEPAPATHGAHSLEHRGVLASRPPPATPKVPPASIGELRYVRSLRSLVTARVPDVVRARGPPPARALEVCIGAPSLHAA
jgi:hypothetical protein